MDPKRKLKSIKSALAEVRKEITELSALCDPPSGIEKLSSALRSIQANAEIVMANGDDPHSPILPWIVQRCKGALGWTKK